MSEGHTKERLKELQALPLERKIGFTIARIVEWHQHYNGKVYVSFSGGKDSTVLLHIARGIFPEMKAMFLDTGLEYPEIREFVRTFDNVDWVRPKMSFKQVIEKYGYPVIGKEIANHIMCCRNVLAKLKKKFHATGSLQDLLPMACELFPTKSKIPGVPSLYQNFMTPPELGGGGDITTSKRGTYLMHLS